MIFRLYWFRRLKASTHFFFLHYNFSNLRADFDFTFFLPLIFLKLSAQYTMRSTVEILASGQLVNKSLDKLPSETNWQARLNHTKSIHSVWKISNWFLSKSTPISGKISNLSTRTKNFKQWISMNEPIYFKVSFKFWRESRTFPDNHNKMCKITKDMDLLKVIIFFPRIFP